MARFLLIISFASFVAYGAWGGCSDSAKQARAANHERAVLLDSI